MSEGIDRSEHNRPQWKRLQPCNASLDVDEAIDCVWQTSLRPIQKYVLFAYVWHEFYEKPRGSRKIISVSVVTEMTGLSHRTAQRTVHALAALGFLKKQRALAQISFSSIAQGIDRQICQSCRHHCRVLQRHHIRLLSEGGIDEDANITLLCPECHILAHSTVYHPLYPQVGQLDS